MRGLRAGARYADVRQRDQRDRLIRPARPLSEDENRLLEEASDPGAPDYPYGERGKSQRDRRISGGRF